MRQLLRSLHTLQKNIFCFPYFSRSQGLTTHCNGDESCISQLAARIRMTGPMTVASYMEEVLTNPVYGYYMNRDVFGAKGDFTTSPEISQMFGELIGVWCVNEWMQAGSPSKVQIVEFGPGRGTLADDMLRVFHKFPAIKECLSMHFVEVSTKLSQLQCQKLCGHERQDHESICSSTHYNQSKTRDGCDVYWYSHLGKIPPAYSIYIAQEFLDALPIHKFQKMNGVWHELLVDVDPEEKSKMRYVFAPKTTVAKQTFLQVEAHEPRDHIEVCPSAGAVVEQVADRIKQDGGSALFIDYGHDGSKTDTFRGFQNHQVVDPLTDPGKSDLTADVDFKYLRKIAKCAVDAHGPISQRTFLQNMGIAYRMETLLKDNTNMEVKRDLISGYDMLINPEKMGERFKCLALTERKTDDAGACPYIPAGFKELC